MADTYQGRARLRGYTPPPRTWTTEERLAALEAIADRAERGDPSRFDDLEAAAHMTALNRAANSHSRSDT